MKEEESLRSKDFSIISHGMSIFSLYFICIVSTTAVTMDMTVFVINCATTRSMSTVEKL